MPSLMITDYATPHRMSTSSVHESEARSTRVNFPLHQARLPARRVRVPQIQMHALVRLPTTHQQSLIQGNIQIRLPSLVILGRMRLRTCYCLQGYLLS